MEISYVLFVLSSAIIYCMYVIIMYCVLLPNKQIQNPKIQII